MERVVCQNCKAEFEGDQCWTCGAVAVVELKEEDLSNVGGGAGNAAIDF